METIPKRQKLYEYIDPVLAQVSTCAFQFPTFLLNGKTEIPIISLFAAITKSCKIFYGLSKKSGGIKVVQK